MPFLTSYSRERRFTFFLRNIPAKRFTPPGSRVAPQPPRILDIGSGDGWFITAAKCVGYDCIGVDPCCGPGLRASADNLPFADNYFDCVVMWEVIERISPDCYQEIERVVRPGGHIILSTPKPAWNWVVELCTRLCFIVEPGTPRIKMVDVTKLPWELKKRSTILAIDQVACFEV